MNLFWLDVGASALSVVFAMALTLMIVGANATASLNLSFAAFTLLQASWAVFALLMKLSLWLGLGNPLVFGEWAAFLMVLSTPLLFVFTIHYLVIGDTFKRRLFYISAFAGIASALLLSSLFLFQHKLLAAPRLLENGTTSLDILPDGLWVAFLPFVFLFGSLVLFWLKRHRIKEYYLPCYVFIFTVGYVGGGLLDSPFPVVSFTNLLSISILGYGVVRKQLFNPLREINIHLEESVKLRTEEIKLAYAEVEKRIENRTRELMAEIANHKKTEAILRESEEKFRNLAEESPNMIFINKRGNIVYANRKCEETMGYTREEIYDPHFDFRSLIVPEHLPAIEQNFKQHMRGEEVKPYEYAVLTKAGKRLETIITTRLIHFAGEPAILGIVTDISSQKKAESLLMRLNEIALSLMHCLTPAEVWSVVGRTLKQHNLCCCILERNREKKEFLLRYLSLRSEANSPPAEVVECFIDEETDSPASMPFPDSGGLAEFFENKLPVFRQEGLASFPVRQKNEQEHSSLAGNTSLSVYMDRFFHLPGMLFLPLLHESEAFGLLIIQSDEIEAEDVPAYTSFSYLVAAAWDKVELLIELTRIINELKLAQEELLHSQKMEVIGRLAGGVAHDFNNILTVINSYTQLLYVSLKENTQAQEDITEIRNATLQAAQLTNKLLSLCKKTDFQAVVLDVNQTITDMRKILDHILGARIKLELDLCEVQTLVKADPGQIEQIMMNLIINARDALPEGGRVAVRSELIEWGKTEDFYQQTALNPHLKQGMYVKITVADTGLGMDEETQQHIFEPFFTTKAENHGTGLGLAIVYSIVKQSNGVISVSSLPGQGTTFTIYFPYCNS